MITELVEEIGMETAGVINLPKGGTIRRFEPSPPGLDLRRADEHQVALYGLPPRPADTDALKLWEEALRGVRMIRPTFQPITGPSQGIVLPKKTAALTSDNLSGVLLDPITDFVQSSVGGWTVPNVYPPAGAADGVWYSASSWLAIYDNAGLDLVRSGCQCRVRTSGGVVQRLILPFWEWVPAGAFSVASFPVAPGDSVFVSVSLLDPSSAHIFMTDVTGGFGVAFTVTAPLGVSLQGKFGAWIVQALQLGTPIPELASFGTVYFRPAYARTAGGSLIQAPTGDTVDMVTAKGDVISKTTVFPPLSLVEVSYFA